MPNISSDTCTLCTRQEIGNLKHYLVDCDYNDGAGHFLMEKLNEIVPNITPDQVIQLNIELQDDLKLPVVHLISAVLSEVLKSHATSIPSGHL